MNVPWIVFALRCSAINALLTYFDINVAARVLGVFLITEIVMLVAGGARSAVPGGGPEGCRWRIAQPAQRLQNLPAPSPTQTAARSRWRARPASACSSRSGHGSGSSRAAMYGEESRKPKKIIPRGDHARWSASASSTCSCRGGDRGHRPAACRRAGTGSRTAGDIFFGTVAQNFGGWAVTMFKHPADDRVIRLRHGVPQLRVALHLRDRPRGPVPGLGRPSARPIRSTARRTSRVFVQTGISLP